MLAFVIVLHQTPVCWSEAGFVCSTKCTDGSAWLLWFWHHFYANRQTCQSTANANENQQHLFPTGLSLWEMRTRTPRTFISASLSLWEMRTQRAVWYNHIYRMDEIKSLSFHIMFYRLFHGVTKYIVSGNTFWSFEWLRSLYAAHHEEWRRHRTSQDTTRSSLLNEGLHL